MYSQIRLKIAVEDLIEDCTNYSSWNKADPKNWEAMLEQLLLIKEHISNE